MQENRYMNDLIPESHKEMKSIDIAKDPFLSHKLTFQHTIGQIVTEFYKKDTVFQNTGTGSIQIDPETNELFILSCAHLFVNEVHKHKSIETHSNNFQYADKATFYLDLNLDQQ